MAYSTVHHHRSMVFDEQRNRAYLQALEKVVTPDSIVLDLGAGLGILGLLAAQLGAKHVYMVEPADVITVTKQIVKDNGFTDRVTCLHGRIEEIILPEKVDIIVSVFTGNFLLQEDLLPSLFYARDHYLKPNGILIPDKANMVAVPAMAKELYEKEVESWSVPHLGIDFSLGRRFSSNAFHFDRRHYLREGATYLAIPETLHTFDFYNSIEASCDTETCFTINQVGMCHGFIGWFDMRLGDKWLSTAPHEPRLHWAAAFLPLDPPLEVEIGEGITFKLKRRPFRDWHWHVTQQNSSQNHSTFLSQAHSPQKLRTSMPTAQPKLNENGHVLQFILSHLDGSHQIRAIAQMIQQQWPQHYQTEEKSLKFVKNMAQKYSSNLSNLNDQES